MPSAFAGFLQHSKLPLLPVVLLLSLLQGVQCQDSKGLVEDNRGFAYAEKCSKFQSVAASLNEAELHTCLDDLEKVQVVTDAPPDTKDDPLANLASVARNVLLLVSLLAFTLVVNNMIEKRGVPIPEALVTVMIGMIAGGVARLVPDVKTDTIEGLEDESALEFMVAFIAPIIFAEGYGLKSREFFDNLTRILTHAFIGTLLSSIVVAVGLFYLPPLSGAPSFSFAECLAFGALISATDPVTTLAIFKEQQMVENGLGYLYYTVLGESILNDAVAITLFTAFGKLVEEDRPLDVAAAGSIALTFFKTFVLSLLIGIAGGILTAMILKLARLGSHENEEEHFYFNVPEIGVALVLSYLPFLVASALDLSGIVAVMFAGISMRHYAHYNMTMVTRQVFLPTIELIASLAETYVFLLLGLGVFLLKDNYSVSLILWAFFFCLVGRAIHVYPFSFIINKCSSAHSVSGNEQHLIWFAGLRGAIAFMCALSFPQNKTTKEEQHRGYFLCTTIILVGITLVGFGWPTTSVLRLLDIRARDDGVEAELTQSTTGSRTQEDGGDAPAPSNSRAVVRRNSVEIFHEQMKRVLMTSDALMQREANQQLAASIRSQRTASIFSGPTASAAPRPSNPTEGLGAASEAGRESLPPGGPVTFGQPPQLGMPLTVGGRPSSASAPGFGRPSAASVPGGIITGRPSAPLPGQAGHADPLITTGRPSAPPRLQGAGSSGGSKSYRMLCNP